MTRPQQPVKQVKRVSAPVDDVRFPAIQSTSSTMPVWPRSPREPPPAKPRSGLALARRGGDSLGGEHALKADLKIEPSAPASPSDSQLPPLAGFTPERTSTPSTATRRNTPDGSGRKKKSKGKSKSSSVDVLVAPPSPGITPGAGPSATGETRAAAGAEGRTTPRGSIARLSARASASTPDSDGKARVAPRVAGGRAKVPLGSGGDSGSSSKSSKSSKKSRLKDSASSSSEGGSVIAAPSVPRATALALEDSVPVPLPVDLPVGLPVSPSASLPVSPPADLPAAPPPAPPAAVPTAAATTSNEHSAVPLPTAESMRDGESVRRQLSLDVPLSSHRSRRVDSVNSPRAPTHSPRAQPPSPRAQPPSPRAQPHSPRAQLHSPRAQPPSPRASPRAQAPSASPRSPAAVPRAPSARPRADPAHRAVAVVAPPLRTGGVSTALAKGLHGGGGLPTRKLGEQFWRGIHETLSFDEQWQSIRQFVLDEK